MFAPSVLPGKLHRTAMLMAGACLVLLGVRGDAATEHDLGGGIRIRTLEAPHSVFILEGLENPAGAPPQDYFRVSIAGKASSSTPQERPAILGRYEVVGNAIRFTPRYNTRSRSGYVVRIGPALQRLLPADAPRSISIAPRDGKPSPTARVVGVYPSSDVLPENLLKFYIHFSEPMSRGRAYEWIELYEGERKIEMPFLELGEELWDPLQQRFTLFIHPGRIKRGVRPNEEFGPPLVAGRTYTLRILPAWKDAQGTPLQSGFEKTFTAGPADRRQLNPEDWKLEAPRSDSREPVAIVFNEPLDHAMLQRVLVVKHRSGRTIAGKIQVLDRETRWQFVPADPWNTGTYFVEVAANLEDLCGNSIARPFETKLQDNVAAHPRTRIAIEFIVQ